MSLVHLVRIQFILFAQEAPENRVCDDSDGGYLESLKGFGLSVATEWVVYSFVSEHGLETDKVCSLLNAVVGMLQCSERNLFSCKSSSRKKRLPAGIDCVRWQRFPILLNCWVAMLPCRYVPGSCHAETAI